MRKLVWAALCAAGTMALAGQANALGPPLTFTLSNSDPAGNGTVIDVPLAGYPGYGLSQAFLITGSDLGGGPATPDETLVTAVANSTTPQDLAGVFFTYSTPDPRGAFADSAGYVVNGVKHQVTYDSTTAQFVQFVIPLVAGDTYGFYIDSTDSLGGPATLRIELGSNAIPEPASWALMISGFGLAGSSLRRRRARASAT